MNTPTATTLIDSAHPTIEDLVEDRDEPEWITCWECDGDGIDPANGDTCWRCHGKGECLEP